MCGQCACGHWVGGSGGPVMYVDHWHPECYATPRWKRDSLLQWRSDSEDAIARFTAKLVIDIKNEVKKGRL